MALSDVEVCKDSPYPSLMETEMTPLSPPTGIAPGWAVADDVNDGVDIQEMIPWVKPCYLPASPRIITDK